MDRTVFVGQVSIVTLLIGCLSLFVAFSLYRKISDMDSGTEKMQKISAAIHEGAMAFLTREYKILIVFVIALVAFLVSVSFFTGGNELPIGTALAFVFGAVSSSLAGFFGMKAATKANVRTAAAAQKGLVPALNAAFTGGSVMGLSVAGLALAGLGVVLLLFHGDMAVINGFALGASGVALFARVGGGIYTKAADVGADLVGKVEAGLDEDDPRNPAVIADNVGDNVGDVAGMGSDLFESFAGAMIAAAILGASLNIGDGASALLPFLLGGGGTISVIIGICFMEVNREKNARRVLNRGTIIAMIFSAFAAFCFCIGIMPESFDIKFLGFTHTYTNFRLFLAVVIGLIGGFLIGKITEYYTSDAFRPVRKIAKSGETGTATLIISGLSTGMISTVLPIVVVCCAILGAFYCGGVYGIAISAVGMLSTVGMIVAVDAYGPIADNGGGIAEMAAMPEKVRKITDNLDSVGNTTAAIGKGFAVGSAALTALSLFTAYIEAAGLDLVNIMNPEVVVGLFLGGMMPFLFSSLTMNGVGRAAEAMISEVRRQFKNNKEILEGTKEPEYGRCVAISTTASLKEMVLPGVLAIAIPLFVGLCPFLGKEALCGVLAGALVTGFLMAIMMSNAGGAWDNAKKYIEKGNFGGKGSDAHYAAVYGDTVGDPFKDTSGPSLNILIKLMTIVALVFVPLF